MTNSEPPWTDLIVRPMTYPVCFHRLHIQGVQLKGAPLLSRSIQNQKDVLGGLVGTSYIQRETKDRADVPKYHGGWEGLLNVQREKKGGQQKKDGDRFLPLKSLAPSHLPGSQNSKPPPPPITELNSRGSCHSFQIHVYPVSSE